MKQFKLDNNYYLIDGERLQHYIIKKSHLTEGIELIDKETTSYKESTALKYLNLEELDSLERVKFDFENLPDEKTVRIKSKNLCGEFRVNRLKELRNLIGITNKTEIYITQITETFTHKYLKKTVKAEPCILLLFKDELDQGITLGKIITE